MRMNIRKTLKQHLLAVGIVLIIGTLLGLSYATFYYENQAAYVPKSQDKEAAEAKENPSEEKENPSEKPVHECVCWYKFLPYGLSSWYPWVLLTPGMLWLSQRFRFQRGSVLLACGVHFVSGPIFGSAKSLVRVFAMTELMGLNVGVQSIGVGTVSIEAFTYWVFVAAYNGLLYYRRYREREIRTSQLETRLAQAQLQVLKMQLHPHFLFNTLHAISTLMQRDIDTADRMVSRLSELLRLSFDNVELQEVSLRRELDFLDLYLDIERIRFGDRLQIEKEIAPETLDALVPNLILQPITENAVNHGISRIASTGRIMLRAAKQDGMLRVEVCDNGPGFAEDAAADPSRVGLANTRARLEYLYGAQGRIVFEAPSEGGTIVRLLIPFHEEPVIDLPGR